MIIILFASVLLKSIIVYDEVTIANINNTHKSSSHIHTLTIPSSHSVAPVFRRNETY